MMMEVDAGPVSHLLCPPRELAECIFQDAFVFPPSSQVATSSTSQVAIGSSSPPQVTDHILPTLHPQNTVDYVFRKFLEMGLYAQGKWTSLARVPDFVGEHDAGRTESSYAEFVNTLVSQAVQVTGIKMYMECHEQFKTTSRIS